jgi:hypothetical protein
LVPRLFLSHAWRIGFSGKVPVLRDGSNEAIRCRGSIWCDDHPRVRLAIGQRRIDVAGFDQLRAFAKDQDRFAMAVLILDELEGSTVGTTSLARSSDGRLEEITCNFFKKRTQERGEWTESGLALCLSIEHVGAINDR